MNTKNRIEKYGHLIKIETLKSVSSQCIPGTLVLEAPEPFPGYKDYYSEHPLPCKPLYIYFVIEGFSSLEQVSRASQVAQGLFPVEFDAAFAVVKINHDEFHTIRIRHLDSFDQVPELQEIYQKAGIKFKKKTTEINGAAIIHLRKLFYLNTISDGVYLDAIELDHGYFTLPFHIDWMGFENLVQKVKFNWNITSSDYALAFFYSNNRIEDIVRLYNPNLTVEYLAEAKRQFLNRI